jgi:hypothetical protein
LIHINAGSTAVGPIATVILGPDDPSIRTALAIAAAAKERVIALAPLGSNAREAIVNMADAAGVRVEAGPGIQEPFDVTLLTQLSGLNERLLVMSRGPAGDRRAATIASLRAIPVLLTHT